MRTSGAGRRTNRMACRTYSLHKIGRATWLCVHVLWKNVPQSSSPRKAHREARAASRRIRAAGQFAAELPCQSRNDLHPKSIRRRFRIEAVGKTVALIANAEFVHIAVDAVRDLDAAGPVFGGIGNKLVDDQADGLNTIGRNHAGIALNVDR